MATADLCSEQDITELVHAFYARLRLDDVLGPIFNTHVNDWDHHLAQLVDFWSSILRGTRRFSGTPMPKHIALPELSPELFRRWLSVFAEITAAHPNQEMGQRADAMAQRIAQSLWYGYQMSRRPDESPAGLPCG